MVLLCKGRGQFCILPAAYESVLPLLERLRSGATPRALCAAVVGDCPGGGGRLRCDALAGDSGLGDCVAGDGGRRDELQGGGGLVSDHGMLRRGSGRQGCGGLGDDARLREDGGRMGGSRR
jgi:hypothetical protein